MRVSFTKLSLSNVALFKEQTLELDSGLSCIVGEPGAGKSLLLDAIYWVFGAQVSAKEVIRTGQRTAKIEVELAIGNASSALQAWVLEQGLDVLLSDESSFNWLLSREWYGNTSRCRLEGYLIPRGAVEALEKLLLQQQRQHGTLDLLQKTKQLKVLDGFTPELIAPLKSKANQAIKAYRSLKLQQETQVELERQWLKELEESKEALTVLEEASLVDSCEAELLQQSIQKLANGETLLKATGESVSLLKGSDSWELQGDTSVVEAMQKVLKNLRVASGNDKSLLPTVEKAEQVELEITELITELEAYNSQIELNPVELENNQQRLALLQKLQRRYAKPLPELISWQSELSSHLIDLEENLASLSTLEEAISKAYTEALNALTELHNERKKLSLELGQKVLEILTELAMPNAAFSIDVDFTEEWKQDAGADQVTFLFSANVGEPLKPLAKVASGGELARVLLALQVALTNTNGAEQDLPVFVFDEIDTGTSGLAAKAIAKQLKKLAELGAQIFTVTHQPVIAAHAHNCLWVEKQSLTDETLSQVKLIKEEDERSKVLSVLAVGEEQADLNQAFAKGLQAV